MDKLLMISCIFSFILICSFRKIGNPSLPPKHHSTDSTLQAERDKFTSMVLDRIKTRKDMYADSVFLNLLTFNGAQRLKVSHFLAVMNYWSEALGVSCTHCHNTAMWESEEKPQKQIARDMYLLRQLSNEQILYSVKNVHQPAGQINCGTCHRGKIRPDSD